MLKIKHRNTVSLEQSSVQSAYTVNILGLNIWTFSCVTIKYHGGYGALCQYLGWLSLSKP